jgi:hypothetical protein
MRMEVGLPAGVMLGMEVALVRERIVRRVTRRMVMVYMMGGLLGLEKMDKTGLVLEN